MSFYEKLSATSVTLIAKYGRTMTRRTETNSGTEYDPTISNVDTSIKAVMSAYSASEADGTLIQLDDKRVITTTALTPLDKIVDGSTVYSIISVEEVKPGGTTLIYKAQVRT